jgi:hypothetical protein
MPPNGSGKVSITEDELATVLEPDFNHSTFIFGLNRDDSPRTWKFVPLPWRFEKNFRKQVMPMLAITYRPFESIFAYFSQQFITESTPSVVKSVFDAEMEVDDFLVKSVHAILIYQDKDITEDWVEANAKSRDQLMGIVERQCEIHRLMDRVGELLAERLGKLVRMMGINIDLDSLKLLWKEASEKLSARITNAALTVDSATGLFTDNTNEPTLPPKSTENKDEIAEPVLVSTKD